MIAIDLPAERTDSTDMFVCYLHQLYNDLIKGFQWDVFAGGIHCLLQYLPQNSWHHKFSSPRLHLNFPGARGSLNDPGNGTTDTAYQVRIIHTG